MHRGGVRKPLQRVEGGTEVGVEVPAHRLRVFEFDTAADDLDHLLLDQLVRQLNLGLHAIGEGEVRRDGVLWDRHRSCDTGKARRIARVAVSHPHLGMTTRRVERAVLCAEVGHLGEGDHRMILRPRVECPVHRCTDGVASNDTNVEELLLERTEQVVAQLRVPRPCDALAEAARAQDVARSAPHPAERPICALHRG